MEKSLYKIDTELMALLQAIEAQEGEITPEQEQALAISQYELETKAIDYGAAILQLNAWAEMADKEAKRITALKKYYAKTADMLKERITSAMERYDVHEVKSATMKVALRKSTVTVIDDLEELPKKFKTVTVETKPLKDDIKQAIKNNEDVPGAHLEDRQNLYIK